MAIVMSYKGYVGKVDFDEHENMLHGRVINTRDMITFMGRTAAETHKALKDSVEEYIKFCREQGLEPNKPYSGKLLVRVDPATHAALVAKAAEEDKSVNELVKEAVEQRVLQEA
jgi:predicted HicB family RNase H-like nuclease